MSKFQVSWCENKVSKAGNAYIRVSLTDEQGKVYPEVAIFDKFPDFANIVAGSTVDGILQSKDYQGKVSYTLVEANFAPKAGFGGGMGAKMMEKKTESIKIAQENKNESIKNASVMRMSHETTLAEIQHIKEGPDGEIMDFNDNFVAIFKKWKSWYENKWDEPF